MSLLVCRPLFWAFIQSLGVLKCIFGAFFLALFAEKDSFSLPGILGLDIPGPELYGFPGGTLTDACLPFVSFLCVWVSLFFSLGGTGMLCLTTGR